MTGKPSVTVVTNQTSPYQVEFMDAVALDEALDLQVIYLYSHRPGRNWSQPAINHPHLIINEDQSRFGAARQWVHEAGLVVFGYYRDRFAYELIRERAPLGKPWCFWGERMGVTNPGWAGAVYRRWKLRWLHQAPAAIWGIGEFALERYRREFGARRTYCNLPYFSDLSRFARVARQEAGTQEVRTVLCSGSLIPRKGVDLLAEAFARVAPAQPQLRLLVMGEGELRPAMEARLQAVAERVEFTGFQDWQALPECYARADVLCAPSRRDGWALVVPEALAAGLPVIATNRMGAALELIEPGRNGWRIEAGQLEPLCRALDAVATLPKAELSRMAHEARQTAGAHSLESGVERFRRAVSASLSGWN